MSEDFLWIQKSVFAMFIYFHNIFMVIYLFEFDFDDDIWVICLSTFCKILFKKLRQKADFNVQIIYFSISCTYFPLRIDWNLFQTIQLSMRNPAESEKRADFSEIIECNTLFDGIVCVSTPRIMVQFIRFAICFFCSRI